jgi:hypothetical protein
MDGIIRRAFVQVFPHGSYSFVFALDAIRAGIIFSLLG